LRLTGDLLRDLITEPGDALVDLSMVAHIGDSESGQASLSDWDRSFWILLGSQMGLVVQYQLGRRLGSFLSGSACRRNWKYLGRRETR
jgi:hypothetical protein